MRVFPPPRLPMVSRTRMKYADGPPSDRLHPDEPWFFLRGQDVLAPHAVSTYASLLRATAAGLAVSDEDAAGRLRSQASECDRIAAEMIRWQADNRIKKIPD